MHDLRKPDACPQCRRGRIVPILYGLPEEHVMERADRGEVILGGCVHFVETDPDWHCRDCEHRWFDPTDPARIAWLESLDADDGGVDDWKPSPEDLAQESAKDALITDRRCPSCGQPCPRYRKTSKHCDFEVGREP